MNVPLNWLTDYVDLPDSLPELTDRLTSVGHMLDKVKEVGGETVIDLELRGNRADMFGLIGVAREVAAVFGSRLRLPAVTRLPLFDPTCPLVEVEPSTRDLVRRYTALQLEVQVHTSPDWLTARLEAYGIPAINNIVDITNYVMLETGHPLHAFDFDKLKGSKLVLRRGRAGEKFDTIQQGTTLTLAADDLAITDGSSVQALTMIGGLHSRVTDSTSHIILESAVYNPANCRQSSRRLKIVTESGLRHEKHQDPQGVAFAISRAVHLLKQFARAHAIGEVSDYYPSPAVPLVLQFPYGETGRLTGLDLPPPTASVLLKKLGFGVKSTNRSTAQVTVPTFRTDVTSPADLVEELIRIHGYDRIPAAALSGAVPEPDSYPSFTLQEKIRDTLTSMGVWETITLTMIDNSHAGPGSVRLTNPPDPDTALLRPRLYPGLVDYALRLSRRRVTRISLFEVGRVFGQNEQGFTESLHLGVAAAGQSDFPHLKGLVDSLQKLLGITLALDFGRTGDVYWAEADLEPIVSSLPKYSAVYSTIPQYPPIIEDINVSHSRPYTDIVARIRSVSPLIQNVELVDKYGDKLTLRLTFHSPDRQLSGADIAPLRQKLEALNQS